MKNAGCAKDLIDVDRVYKMKKVDMSEAAILRRLKTGDQLRTLCLALIKAKKESNEKKNDASTTEKKK